MNKFDNFVGLGGIVVGLIGIGYAMGTRSKMARISEKLDRSIDELAGRTPVDIPHDMIERAVEKAVAAEARIAVGKATDAAIMDVKRDVHKQVCDAVESEYSDIKATVLREITDEAAKIDVKRVRDDVEQAARKIALDKFDDNLDDMLKDFNEQLKNTSKIYTSIADAMTGYKPSGRETVFRIG